MHRLIITALACFISVSVFGQQDHFLYEITLVEITEVQPNPDCYGEGCGEYREYKFTGTLMGDFSPEPQIWIDNYKLSYKAYYGEGQLLPILSWSKLDLTNKRFIVSIDEKTQEILSLSL